jgi:hypothetical protein
LEWQAVFLRGYFAAEIKYVVMVRSLCEVTRI